jgi:hypothetical protein
MQIINYVLIVLLLVLVGVAGLQFTYLFYADRLDRDRRRYLKELERKAKELRSSLEAAEEKIAEQHALIEKFIPEYIGDEDVWLEVIEEI